MGRLLCLMGLHQWDPSRNPAETGAFSQSSRSCDRCGAVWIRTGLDGWRRVR